MTGRTIDELAVGDVAEMTQTITAESIRGFVGASGDANPIHSDPIFAASSRFGRTIAPGMLSASLVSAVIGTRLPGPGTIYISQNLRFLRPVYAGDQVTARAEVAERIVERNRIRLLTTCVNQDGEPLLEGEAWVLPSRTHIEYESPARAARSCEASSYEPAALAIRTMSLLMVSGLALADQALRLYQVRPLKRVPQPSEADPVRS